MSSDIRFRPATDADFPFLEALYASTRETELAQTDWSDEQKRRFLSQQFSLQHRYYRQHYTAARFDIVQWQGRDIGRLYVYDGPSDVRLIDIALMPEYRGRGIGSSILRDLMADAAAAGKGMSLHVETFNPAAELYRRLRFTEQRNNGVYLFMTWRADAALA